MDLCSITHCTVEPQPLAGAIGGPLLAIGLLASVLAPAPKRLYDGAFGLVGAIAGALMVAVAWSLLSGQREHLLILSGAGCAALSLAIWLGRGENDGPDGFEDPEPDPDPEPGLSVDWDEFSRRLADEERRARKSAAR